MNFLVKMLNKIFIPLTFRGNGNLLHVEVPKILLKKSLKNKLSVKLGSFIAKQEI